MLRWDEAYVNGQSEPLLLPYTISSKISQAGLFTVSILFSVKMNQRRHLLAAHKEIHKSGEDTIAMYPRPPKTAPDGSPTPTPTPKPW